MSKAIDWLDAHLTTPFGSNTTPIAITENPILSKVAVINEAASDTPNRSVKKRDEKAGEKARRRGPAYKYLENN